MHPLSKSVLKLLDACIYDAVNTLLKLGGYVVLFSVLAEMTACLPFPPKKTAALLGGMLEITSGISGVVKAFSPENCLSVSHSSDSLRRPERYGPRPQVFSRVPVSPEKVCVLKVVTAALTFLFVSFFLWS